MNVVVLVPRRAGVEDRDRIWQFVSEWWTRELPDARIVCGDHDDGPFNRSKAMNAAARNAGDWDVAVILDADVLTNVDHVHRAIERAVDTGGPVLAFTERVCLNRGATRRVLGGWRGDWRARGSVQHVYTDMCSSVVVVTRALWDAVGGFDEGFVGWGYEDNAFMCAAETLSGCAMERIPGECWHLYHRTQRRVPALLHSNRARLGLYNAAHMDPDAMRAVLDQRGSAVVRVYDEPVPIIPAVLHRTVPKETTREVEEFWRGVEALHPGWKINTWRDPLVPSDFPITSPLWAKCASGAQRAGLIRLEVLVRDGGIYLDSDVELYRPLDVLRYLPAFAGWEDAKVVPDAVLGCVPGHPAFVAALDAACEAVNAGKDAWQSGPGVTTTLLRGRDDVLLLPPGSFYPYHYKEKERRDENHKRAQPWSFGAHHWAGSWL